MSERVEPKETIAKGWLTDELYLFACGLQGGIFESEDAEVEVWGKPTHEIYIPADGASRICTPGFKARRLLLDDSKELYQYEIIIEKNDRLLSTPPHLLEAIKKLNLSPAQLIDGYTHCWTVTSHTIELAGDDDEYDIITEEVVSFCYGDYRLTDEVHTRVHKEAPSARILPRATTQAERNADRLARQRLGGRRRGMTIAHLANMYTELHLGAEEDRWEDDEREILAALALLKRTQSQV